MMKETHMRYEWMDGYLMGKRAVTKDLQPEWNWIRYHVGGKMFAAILRDDQNRPVYINLKLEPVEGEFLRQQFEDIIPGYYSDKRCWNSVMPDGAVPDELLRELLDTSYRLVLAGFSRKKRREILGLTACGAECAGCEFHGSICAGCNESGGRVFHAPAGKACPIFACCAKNGHALCGECEKLPCEVWRATRDPSMSDAAFEASIRARVDRLRL